MKNTSKMKRLKLMSACDFLLDNCIQLIYIDENNSQY